MQSMEASSGEKANTCSSRFLQLQYPLIFDILSRLSIDDLFRCRCVCKSFLCFIHDPEFARLHLSRSTLSMSVKIDCPYYSKRLHLADVGGKNVQVSELRVTPKSGIYAMSSCNGLICLLGTKADDCDDFFFVCNPILGEYTTIQPPYSSKGKRRGRFWGLGYSSLTKQYKILQTYYDNIDWVSERPDIRDVVELSELVRASERAEIYTIGSGTWRSIGNAPKDSVYSPFNPFFNGVIHWSKLSPKGGEFITSFNFDAEQFGTVPPPDHFLELDEESADSAQKTITGVLGGCLFIIHFANPMTHFDIWVMKEYGVKESWTKQFVVENLYPKGSGLDFYLYQPMVVSSEGDIFMLLKPRAVVCYNQERKQFREVLEAQPVFEDLDAVAYTPCFVSLYNVAKGEEISRTRSNGVYDKICKEEFLDCIG